MTLLRHRTQSKQSAHWTLIFVFYFAFWLVERQISFAPAKASFSTTNSNFAFSEVWKSEKFAYESLLPFLQTNFTYTVFYIRLTIYFNCFEKCIIVIHNIVVIQYPQNRPLIIFPRVRIQLLWVLKNPFLQFYWRFLKFFTQQILYFHVTKNRRYNL